MMLSESETAFLGGIIGSILTMIALPCAARFFRCTRSPAEQRLLDACERLKEEIVTRNDEWYAREAAAKMGISWECALGNHRRNGFVFVDGKRVRVESLHPMSDGQVHKVWKIVDGVRVPCRVEALKVGDYHIIEGVNQTLVVAVAPFRCGDGTWIGDAWTEQEVQDARDGKVTLMIGGVPFNIS